jgi:elongation factor Ts
MPSLKEMSVMAVSIESIKQLREMTLASISDCKTALDEADGDLEKAAGILKKKGLEIAASRASRSANEGRIEAYVHIGNRIGVLVEVNCETDFVARNEDFVRFTKDVAMQIAASNPRFLKEDDVPKDKLEGLNEKEKKEYLSVNCLLSQPFIRDAKMTIQDCLTTLISRIGEKIVVKRFSRFKLGEDEKQTSL